ncbi:hypothetical protein OGCDGJMD_01605 [Cyanobium usitatum str. Tous]|uniref:hypothetical protein n=1 Tax=Cyanobium usitatum TaxID=2304190 RepID=UPI002AD3B90D|nr:hypothetical protein [Cyanobium usitatum]CAK6694301.1 hypothetical protein OGCDGJMD_01605 [Cyanobium usitatum str. Tous]
MASFLSLWKACGPVVVPLLVLSVAVFTVGFVGVPFGGAGLPLVAVPGGSCVIAPTPDAAAKRCTTKALNRLGAPGGNHHHRVAGGCCPAPAWQRWPRFRDKAWQTCRRRLHPACPLVLSLATSRGATTTNITSTSPNRVLNRGLPSLCLAAQLAP